MGNLRKRIKKVCGVGINDADYKTQIYNDNHERIWVSFCNKFDEYRVDGIYHYTFEKPEFTLK